MTRRSEKVPGERFDFVIVGGGTAGCVLANRLSADPANSVVLIEAGTRKFSPWVDIPAGFSKLLAGSHHNWRFETEPEDSVFGRRIVVPRGKGLGGSSLINGMIYVRGQRQDFDLWAQQGARGWAFDDVLPYFKRLESFQEGDPELRGRDGPLSVVRVTERNQLADAFIAAGEQAGFPRNPDYNGASQDGFGYYQVTQKKGRRWSAYDGYLRPVLGRPNLHVVTDTLAVRIELDGQRASGVLLLRKGEPFRVAARREVLLTAGAIQSPHLLELSGIGDPTRLAAAGIPILHPVEGVGANYQDHFATRMNWRVTRPITLNELSRGWRLGLAVARYYLRRTGILTLGTGLAHGFVRTRPELDGPDVQYFFMHASYANAADRALDRQPGMTVGVTQLRPQSRGLVHARSPDPHQPPAIRPNFLADPIDRETLVAGMREARRIIDQPAMDPYRANELNPGSEVNTEAEWLDFARRNGQTIYHPIGTCRMGPGPSAVVDERLRLHGLRGLRIIDASIMPTMVSANTQAAVMMIAEKGADMILQDAKQAA